MRMPEDATACACPTSYRTHPMHHLFRHETIFLSTVRSSTQEKRISGCLRTWETGTQRGVHHSLHAERLFTFPIGDECFPESRRGRCSKPDQANCPGSLSTPSRAPLSQRTLGHPSNRQKTCREIGFNGTGPFHRRDSRQNRASRSSYLNMLLNHMLRWPALVVIRIYKLCISPWLGDHCRFYPSCSQYAYEAIAKHGMGKGGWMALKRLCKCHPFHPGGVDHVP